MDFLYCIDFVVPTIFVVDVFSYFDQKYFSKKSFKKISLVQYLSLHEEHSNAIARTVPKNMTDERAMMAISVAPI